MAATQRGVRALHRPFDVLRVVVASPDDEKVLRTAGDEQLSRVHEAQIAGAQVAQSRPLPGGRLERRVCGVRFVPVAAADRGAADQDLPDAVSGNHVPGRGVYDRDLRALDGHAAAHQSARIAGRRSHDALLQGIDADAQIAGRRAMGLAGDAQSGLGESVGRRESGTSKAVRGEGGQEILDRHRVDRLRAAARVAHAAEIGGPTRLSRESLRAGCVCKVGSCCVRDPESRERFEPAQRPAYERQWRHQVRRSASEHGHEDALHQAVVVEVRQPAQEPGLVIDVRPVARGINVREHVRVSHHDAARHRRRSRRVLQIGKLTARAERARHRLIGQRVGLEPPALREALGGLPQTRSGQSEMSAGVLGDQRQTRGGDLQSLWHARRYGDHSGVQASPQRADEFESGWVDEQHAIPAGTHPGNLPR